MGSSKIISTKAKFTIKKNSGAAEGLTVITRTHSYKVGEFFIIDAGKNIRIAKDAIVEEDVWIGINATLLPRSYCRQGFNSGSI